ncbi:TMEM43 family protein [Mesorhizobium sp. Z1-4]|uniref:TMEM43 family protein n=1 Tax=Mesorhizobium sp. Z1-4 TaxID=2448478 RepID=UPI000FD7C73E|nr:TMEM43 family protein [Mesorhizobium sp. Z1-4]
MSDQFTETTSVSWFGRLRRSVGGILFGLILLVGMVMLLFWNEGRAVTTARSLAEGAGIVVSVSADAVNPANEGKLVHVTGTVETQERLTDTAFGVTTSGVRLRRNVEMYQWKETASSKTETKLGGGEETVTTYSYSREWSSVPIGSSGFKQPDGHQNPPMNIESQSFQISAAKLGAFDLQANVIGRIGGARDVPVGPDVVNAVRVATGGNQPVSALDGRIYISYDPSRPRVGDYRIGYSLVPLGPISVVGEQQGTSFDAYQTVAGDKLLMVHNGISPAEAMFADAVTGNTVLTWVLRIVGLVFLGVAFGLLLAPIGVVADVIPFLGRIVRMGTGLVAFALAALVGSITIALAWFWYRPVLALVILIVGTGIFYGVSYLGKKREAQGGAEAAAEGG